MLFKAFFEGVFLGLVVAITLGPAFFTIIQTGIDRGFRSAMFISIPRVIKNEKLVEWENFLCEYKQNVNK